MRRRSARRARMEEERLAAEQAEAVEAGPELCPLCDRPLGARSEKHHVVPKSRGGTEMVPLHPICHRKIHSVFSNRELEVLGSIEALRRNGEIEKYVKWVGKRPPDFSSKTRRHSEREGRWKRK